MSRRNGRCYVGHEMTAENTYTTPDGDTKCRECGRALWRDYYHRRKAKLLKEAT